MLCLPALTPVANDAHAVGDSGECVVPSGRTPLPRAASFFMFGSLPSSIHFWTRRGSMPSKPRMTSFCWNFCGGRRGPHAAAALEADDKRGEQDAFHNVLGEKKLYHSGLVTGRILAVDVGARRVGLAISDASRTLARPLETHRRHERRRCGRARRAPHRRSSIGEDEGIATIVVGHAVEPRRDADAADRARAGVHRAR